MNEQQDEWAGPSRSELKRQSQHAHAVGVAILELSAAQRRGLVLPEDIQQAVDLALGINARGGLKRQRAYLAKLLRNADLEAIEERLTEVRHRHDTNTSEFHRLERLRDALVNNDKQAFDELVASHPGLDRQHLNQLARAAAREQATGKPPQAARKLFRYLRELGSTEATD